MTCGESRRKKDKTGRTSHAPRDQKFPPSSGGIEKYLGRPSLGAPFASPPEPLGSQESENISQVRRDSNRRWKKRRRTRLAVGQTRRTDLVHIAVEIYVKKVPLRHLSRAGAGASRYHNVVLNRHGRETEMTRAESSTSNRGREAMCKNAHRPAQYTCSRNVINVEVDVLEMETPGSNPKNH